MSLVTFLGLTSLLHWSCDGTNARDQYFGTDAGRGFEAPGTGGDTGAGGAGGDATGMGGATTGAGGDTSGTGGASDDGGTADAPDEVGALPPAAGRARLAIRTPSARQSQKGRFRG